MKNEDLEIGCAPTEEQSATGGQTGSLWRAWHEGRAFLSQLRRTFGPEPAGCELYLRQTSDSLGWHETVRCSFDKNNREAAAYASRVLTEKPTRWDAQARAFMGLDAQPSLPLSTPPATTAETPPSQPPAPRTTPKPARQSKHAKPKPNPKHHKGKQAGKSSRPRNPH